MVERKRSSRRDGIRKILAKKKEGVGKVKGSTIANSSFELRKAIMKHLSVEKYFKILRRSIKQ